MHTAFEIGDDMKRLLASAVVVGLALVAPTSNAIAADEKHRELGAHEHGHGTFNVAIEGNRISMELEAPGADIVGFEYKAKTKKQKAAVAAAKRTLKKPAKVVGLPAAAGCKLLKASVKLLIEGGDDHDDHKHKKHKKKKAHSHGHSHDKKHSSKSSADKEEASHSEFHVEYEFKCAASAKLNELKFSYFDTFKGAKELDVNMIGPAGQKKF